MQFQKITLAIAAVAASVLACTGTHEASAKNTTPDRSAEPASLHGVGSMTSASVSTPARAVADTDTTVRPRLVVPEHPTPPVLDSLIKGTLPARGLYVFRFAANAPVSYTHLTLPTIYSV